MGIPARRVRIFAAAENNDVIGGPNYGNQFDPITGTWRTDPVIRRGPIVTEPDGTTTQEWFYRDRKGKEYSATAYFGHDNNLTTLANPDFAGVNYTSFRTVDGITLPTTTNRMDAGRAIDDAALVYDIALTITGLPELGWTAGRMIGTRLVASQLAAGGTSGLGTELILSQLSTRGATVTGEVVPSRQFSNPAAAQTWVPGKGENYVARYGRGPFSNQMSGDLSGELAKADAAGIRPITPADSGFDSIINSGEKIKWAVTTDGQLLVIPHGFPGYEVPHSVLTRGADVLAAGEAQIGGNRSVGYFGLELTPHSGHFRPSLESLQVGREAFARYGIDFL